MIPLRLRFRKANPPLQFLAEWQSPVPLDVIFDSPHIDWSYSSYAPEQHPVFGQKRLAAAAASAADLDIIHFDRLAVDATFGIQSWNPRPDRPFTPGFEQRDIAYQSPWIKVGPFVVRDGLLNLISLGYCSSSRTAAWSTDPSSTSTCRRPSLDSAYRTATPFRASPNTSSSPSRRRSTSSRSTRPSWRFRPFSASVSMYGRAIKV